MKYFDSHAHYYDERFESECKEGVDNLIDALLADSVSFIINVGTSPETSRLAINQAKKHGNMYTAVGIHPSDSQYLGVGLDEALSDIEALIKNPENKCVCLGEIGLDYHYPDTDKDCQMKYFKAQMALAERLSIPVSIHDREAHGDVMEVIRSFPRVRGVLHSFSGSAEMAAALVKRGYYISISGVVTFKNARQSVDVVREIPLQNLLIETDSPYLTPHPHRGKRNHSGYLVHVIDRIAEIKNITPDEVREATTKNACKIFRIPLL